MKLINPKVLITACGLVLMSCKGQKIFTSYKDCMDKSFRFTDVDFYRSLSSAEDELLKMGALKSKNREGYVDAFRSLNANDEIWKRHYRSYLVFEKSFLKGFDLKTNNFVFFGVCSSIDPRFEDVKFNSTNVQRYLFRQFVHKPLDNNDLLDGLILFTDFNNDNLRNNITYLLLLNMEKKYATKSDL